MEATFPDFEIAMGTVAGTEHTRIGKNNQDSLCVRFDGKRLVVVVTDGCSSSTKSGSHNEIGARFGAHLVATELWHNIDNNTGEPNWPVVRHHVVSNLGSVVSMAGGLPGGDAGLGLSRTELVSDMFLFTILAACITPTRATFAAIGDGVPIINGERIKLGPFPNNAPPYIGYALVDSSIPKELLEFNVFASMPTEMLQSFLLGTDGTDDLIRAWDRVLPSGQHVGVIDRLWTDDRFFRNPDVLRRHLMLANGGINHSQPGYLPDDTTLVAGRRKSRG